MRARLASKKENTKCIIATPPSHRPSKTRSLDQAGGGDVGGFAVEEEEGVTAVCAGRGGLLEKKLKFHGKID